MKRYSVSDFRKQLSRALDQVEQGEEVVVQRGDRRFRIQSERASRPVPRRAPFLTVLDPKLLEEGWRWSWTPDGLRLQVHGKRRS